jgi:uncharacterized membrane-anchored protein
LRSVGAVTVVFWLLSVHAFLSGQSCKGDQPILSLSPVPSDFIPWISGPANAPLGEFVSIQIPGGYRFVDARSASILLERMKNPVPKGLVGILTPDSGRWWIVLEFVDTGYVKDVDKHNLDAARIMKAVWNRIWQQNENQSGLNSSTITSLDWDLEPVYDPNEHTLEWAVRADSESGSVVNHTVRLLGRKGVLDATAVLPHRNIPDTIPLKQLMKGVSFKEGERYADYQDGDKVSDLGLAGMITGEDSAAEQGNSIARIAGNKIFWIGLGCLACAVAGGFLRWRKLRRQRMSNYVYPNERHEPAGTGALVVKNGSNNHRNTRRERVFDYQKFYSAMILQVSGFKSNTQPSTAEHPSPVAVKQALRQPAREDNSDPAAVHLQLELIANQKKLIEEQQWLIREQTKLIAEKNKLAEEKHQLLEKQRELAGDDIFQKTLSF